MRLQVPDALLVHGQLSFCLSRLISTLQNSCFAFVLFFFQFRGFSGQTLVDDLFCAVTTSIHSRVSCLFWHLSLGRCLWVPAIPGHMLQTTSTCVPKLAQYIAGCTCSCVSSSGLSPIRSRWRVAPWLALALAVAHALQGRVSWSHTRSLKFELIRSTHRANDTSTSWSGHRHLKCLCLHTPCVNDPIKS
jgi:hypothetical protein